jgi:hypothetical protein
MECLKTNDFFLAKFLHLGKKKKRKRKLQKISKIYLEKMRPICHIMRKNPKVAILDVKVREIANTK